MKREKPTLVIRCPHCGGRLVGVFVRNGRPIAEVSEDGWAIRRKDEHSQPKITLHRRMVSHWDLQNEYPERTMVQASCKCGPRTQSLAEVLRLFQSGASGNVMATDPVIGKPKTRARLSPGAI